MVCLVNQLLQFEKSCKLCIVEHRVSDRLQVTIKNIFFGRVSSFHQTPKVSLGNAKNDGITASVAES